MMIATESVSETEIESENQAEDHPSGNGSRNGSVNENENENEIDATRGEIPHIVQDTKNTQSGKEDNIEDMTGYVRSRNAIAISLLFGVNYCCVAHCVHDIT